MSWENPLVEMTTVWTISNTIQPIADFLSIQHKLSRFILATSAESVEIKLRKFDLEIIGLRDCRAWHVKQIHDAVALAAFEMGMEIWVAIEADFRVLYFHRLDKLLCKQQL